MATCVLFAGPASPLATILGQGCIEGQGRAGTQDLHEASDPPPNTGRTRSFLGVTNIPGGPFSCHVE